MRGRRFDESVDRSGPPSRQRIDNLVAFGPGDHLHGDASRPADPAIGVLADRVLVGDGIERHQEYLALVDPSLPCAGTSDGAVDDGRAPGVEDVLAWSGQAFPGQRPDATAQAESATLGARDVVGEVVDPVAFVDPTAVAGNAALHDERIRDPRVAERDHGLGEADGNLHDVLV